MVVHSVVSGLFDSIGIQTNPIQTESEGWERHWRDPSWGMPTKGEGGRQYISPTYLSNVLLAFFIII
jgi:hypothetical protein